MAPDQVLPPPTSGDEHFDAVIDKSDRTMRWLYDTVRGIVDIEGGVQIHATISATIPTTISFNVALAPGGAGQVIGKSGRTARSLRTLLGCRSKKDGVTYFINIEEGPRAL